jgi:CubicO group peptidase (beta-lactamase class C family)
MTEQGVHVDGARDAGCEPDALRRAFGLLEEWVADGVIPGAAAVVARGGRVAGEAYVGQSNIKQQRSVRSDTIWSIASITKPITAAAVLMLAEQGRFSLGEQLSELIPEFLEGPVTPFDRQAVTLRHLLSHCSGLPGVSEDNIELRRAHRPIGDYVRSHLRQALLFSPGTRHYYSNCGLSLAGEVVGRALAGGLGRESGEPQVGRYHPFVQESILAPLGMADSTFFPPEAWIDRIAWVEGTGQAGMDWESPNSPYYRTLGYPWGGIFSTARDLIRFVDLFQPPAAGRQRIGAGPNGGAQIVSPATARAMTSEQWSLPDASARLRPDLRDSLLTQERPLVSWGLGWELRGTKQLDRSGDLSSPRAYSHLGGTGTMAWGDPATDVSVVLLANQALLAGWTTERPRQAMFSNAVCASLL